MAIDTAPPRAHPPPGLDQHDQARLTITPDASATTQGGQISTGEGGSVSSPAPTGGVLVHNGGTAATRPRSGRWARCSAVGVWSVFLGFVHVLGRGSR